jgi:alkanesulfonate monooxygenase SsuD/methylene tetrahydromethanopterin reductase-like flavin-dependent oxidoreductase (luciferase family)
LQFGLFDHIDLAADRPLAQQYDERLQFVAAADDAGFYAYHLAEHHATPLNTVPVPGTFLAAVARATKRIRMGPMVYLLPLYSPLRLIEEISILDHLSHGRLEIGVGRGVSPYELNFHKVDAEKSREIFIDAYDCMIEGLTHDRLTYHGPFYNYDNVPMILRPLQQPHPAMWYGSSNTVGAAWAGERGLHFASNGATERAKENIDAYEALRRDDLKSRPGYVDSPSSADYELSLREGSTIAGSPETVRKAIEAQIDRLGINYLICYMMFGTMSLADALRSLELFTTEVRPKVRTNGAAAASR